MLGKAETSGSFLRKKQFSWRKTIKENKKDMDIILEKNILAMLAKRKRLSKDTVRNSIQGTDSYEILQNTHTHTHRIIK